MSAHSRTAAPKLTDLSDYDVAVERLPYWARSTNPIVRRHLGLYWRTMPPDVQPFVVIFLVWSVLLAVGVLVPPLMSFTMITFLASLMVLPLAWLYYANILLHIASEAAYAMQSEMENDTLNLLRTTPMSIPQILLGKVAASMWKHMDDLVMLAQLTLAFSPPVIFTTYSQHWAAEGSTIAVAPLLTLVGMIVGMLRIFAEPLMVGMLAVFVGIVVPGRSRAISGAVFIAGFYFVLLNLMSSLPGIRGFEGPGGVEVGPNVPLMLLFDLVLPLVLPLLILYGLLKLGEWLITRD